MFWIWIGSSVAFWIGIVVLYVKKGIPGEREMKKEKEREREG